MARAMALARGEAPPEESASDESASEDLGDKTPTAEEVESATQTISAWAAKKKSSAKMLERVGDLNSLIGTRATALRALNGKPKSAAPLLVVPNLLPTSVAEAALVLMRALPEEHWDLASAKTDQGKRKDGAGTTRHSFAGYPREDAEGLLPIFAALDGILPGQRSLLQCGRYKTNDFIEPHDDMAFATLDGQEYSRDVAVVLHLTPGWGLADGGAFVDHAGGSARCPTFNTLVVFRVPRMHEVSPVTTRAARYSMYGWFLAPGKLYTLDAVKQAKPQNRPEKRIQSDEPAGSIQKKRKKKKRPRAEGE